MRATMRRGRKRSADRLTYDVEETGVKLGISRTQAYEAAKNGELPTIRIGKRLLVPKAALDRMLADPADAG
jgi:excisionase family DNA binding protein